MSTHLGGRPRKVGGLGANKHCVFGNCKSDSRKQLSSYDFLPFAKPCLQVRKKLVDDSKAHILKCQECEKCMRWITKCKRDDNRFSKLSHVTKDTYICSKHFVGKEISWLYPDPLPEDKVLEINAKKRTKRKIPADESSSCKKIKELTSLPHCAQGSKLPHQQAELQATDLPQQSTSYRVSGLLVPEYEESNDQTMAVSDTGVNTIEKATQTTFRYHEYLELQDKLKAARQEIASLKKTIEDLNKRGTNDVLSEFEQFEIELKENPKKCKFYTNLDFDLILILIKFLNIPEGINYWGQSKRPIGNTKKKNLTIQQEIILTLVRLKSGLLVQDLAYRFKFSTGFISKTVTTCVQLMYTKFCAIRPEMFATRSKISENLPDCFKNLKNIRVIIDCAEFFCQTPSNFEQQSNLYSQYKAHTTFKVLLGCTPNGAISFVSELFEGSISDKELVKQSKLTDLLHEGDLVLADRGFNIKDMTDAKKAHLNIPPFLKGRKTLTPEEEIETKKIARNRIYIEHAVGRLKNFRLLQKIIPLSMRPIISQMVFVCACLLNFQQPMVKGKEPGTAK